jgi:hypothetical protein
LNTPRSLRRGYFFWPQKELLREAKTLWLVIKLIAFWSSLLRRSYHCSSDQKTNLSQKFSPSQGKYIRFYTLSVTQPVCGLWLVPVLIWAVFPSWHVVSCDCISISHANVWSMFDQVWMT